MELFLKKQIRFEEKRKCGRISYSYNWKKRNENIIYQISIKRRTLSKLALVKFFIMKYTFYTLFTLYTYSKRY